MKHLLYLTLIMLDLDIFIDLRKRHAQVLRLCLLILLVKLSLGLISGESTNLASAVGCVVVHILRWLSL